MAGQQVSQSRPSAPDRELAKLALSATEWDSVEMARRFTSTKVVRDTRDELERSKTPLVTYEPRLDGSLSATVRAHLNTIGAAMRPDLSGDQAASWVNAMLIKLSDLPPNVAAKATERALHVAFEFPSQVEAKVRELAQEHIDRIDQAIRRMAALIAAIHEALNPRPRLTTTVDDDKPMDDAEVHELQRKGGMCKAILNLGLSRGFIRPEQLLPPDDPTLPQEDKSND